MILLDTNVISALMRNPPDQVIVAWMDAQPEDELWTTALSVFEIRFGLSQLPDGARRRALEDAFKSVVRNDFVGRIAGLDATAADAAGRLAARRQAAGRTADIRDTLIAGIALARRASIATRNIRHFDDLEIRVIEPSGARPGSEISAPGR